jgi:hypothetical protein
VGNEIRDGQIWLTDVPESTYNTSPTTGADYEAIVSAEAIVGILPGIEKTDDADRQGTGTEFATHTCNRYWNQPQIRIANDQELFAMFGRMWLRAAGGPVVDDVVGTTGQRHRALLQNSAVHGTRQLPGTSLIFVNGVDDFLLSGMVIASSLLSKQAAVQPTLAFDLVGTGKHTSPNGVTSKPTYAAPTACSDGSGFIVKFTKADSTVVDLSTVGCQFKELNVPLNNNVKLNDRCDGDPKLTQNLGTASYVQRVLRQRNRDRLLPNFGFLLNDLNVYQLMTKNEVVTSVTLAIRGPAIAGGTAFYELGVEIPKATFVDVAAADFDGEQGYRAGLRPLYDSGINNGARFYVINETASNFK